MDNQEIVSHRVNECNQQIKIIGRSPGAGGAFTKYDITGPSKQVLGVGMVPSFGINMKFQDGPIDAGVNGITNEVLLAILESRLVGFQSGRFAHPKNAAALEYIRSATKVLNQRTEERKERGVEGTHEV